MTAIVRPGVGKGVGKVAAPIIFFVGFISPRMQFR
jgi:hypothetical protein